MRVTPRYDGPAILEIDGPLDDQLAPVTRQRRRFAAMLAELSDEQWRAPSRCEGWNVQDVASHLVGVDAFWQMSIVAGLAGEPTRVLTNFDPATTPAMLIQPLRALPPAEVLGQLVASMDRFLDVLASLDAAGWATPVETPPGHLPVRLLAHHALWDCWVHERDVALPLGITPPLEPDEVIASMRYAAALSPGFLINDGPGCKGRFAVEARRPDTEFWLEVDGMSVHVHDGAAPAGTPCLRGDAVELTDALSIRGPLPADAPPEWRAIVGGLTTAFS
jgi:uncharacterized protein (TIGR03083 family)